MAFLFHIGIFCEKFDSLGNKMAKIKINCSGNFPLKKSESLHHGRNLFMTL